MVPNHGHGPRRPGRRPDAGWTFKRPGAFALILAFIVILAFPAGSAAASGGITLQILPAAVTLSAGEQATVDLAISNTTSVPVRVTAVDIRTPAQVMTENVPSPGSIGPIRADGFVLASFTLKAGLGLENGEVDVLLRYRCASAGSGTAEQLVTGSLTLTAGPAAAVPRVAFLSFPDKLNDGQSVTAAVSISNPAPFPLTQVRVTAVDSEDVTLSQVAPVPSPFAACPARTIAGTSLVGCLDTLAPGAMVVLYLQVRASSQVQTGTQHVAVIVASQTGTSADPVASTVAASTPVQVTIFGVDALSPFGLATLFVLPGIVTVLVFLLLARYVYPRSKELPESVPFNDARTLVFVAPPAALAYLLVWTFWGVDLANQAGTDDVVLLFGLGILLGAIAWGVVAAMYFWRSGRKQFTRTDSVDKVLKRLHARDALLLMPALSSAGLSYRYLDDGPGGQLVACPPVVYAVTPKADQGAGTRFREARKANNIRAIRRERRAGNLDFKWQQGNGVTLLGGSTVPTQEVSLFAGEDLPDEE